MSLAVKGVPSLHSAPARDFNGQLGKISVVLGTFGQPGNHLVGKGRVVEERLIAAWDAAMSSATGGIHARDAYISKATFTTVKGNHKCLFASHFFYAGFVATPAPASAGASVATAAAPASPAGAAAGAQRPT